MRGLADDVCELILLRHGATDSNVARPARLQGRGVNLGLNAAGRLQAEKTATFLARYAIDAIYCSPLLRAVETAEIVARPHELSVQPIAELIEVDVGRWEGRDWDDVAKNDPVGHRLFLEDPALHGYPSGENMQQVQDRVTAAFNRLLAANLGNRILVVAHNVVNRAYLAGVIGLPTSRCRNLMQNNCCINFLQHREGETHLQMLNVLVHLEE